MVNKKIKPVGYWFSLIYTILSIVGAIAMAVAKWLGYFDRSWWFVTAPIWGSLVMVFFLLGCAALLVLVAGDKLKDL